MEILFLRGWCPTSVFRGITSGAGGTRGSGVSMLAELQGRGSGPGRGAIPCIHHMHLTNLCPHGWTVWTPGPHRAGIRGHVWSLWSCEGWWERVDRNILPGQGTQEVWFAFFPFHSMDDSCPALGSLFLEASDPSTTPRSIARGRKSSRDVRQSGVSSGWGALPLLCCFGPSDHSR